ncbi:hypothetical protein PAT3040_06837 [Paenibacillus agaridevorans]|uniref:Uncharacterized protein n=1 Tax=Paenibacillus agaridevorans TaxID=171404 RepID=A0A2R5F2X6_9BACL|nr:hypothetical protein [Paenibacillus agaridevorans]GBG11978.1 hypothetical protein PAT3040_06837 [Paenibacillus agaridevorans]
MTILFNRVTVIMAALLILAALASPSALAAPQSVQPEPRKAAAPDEAGETGLKPVQAFDVAQGKVVRSVPNDKSFQKMSKKWLKSVTGLAPQMTADNSCTFVYRIPLAKPAVVKADAISITTNDVFLFYCENNPPLLLVFDGERKPYLLLFKEDIKPFIRKVGIPVLAD